MYDVVACHAATEDLLHTQVFDQVDAFDMLITHVCYGASVCCISVATASRQDCIEAARAPSRLQFTTLK
jgi:hypothetical protein